MNMQLFQNIKIVQIFGVTAPIQTFPKFSSKLGLIPHESILTVFE